jgi:hypothetical protein
MNATAATDTATAVYLTLAGKVQCRTCHRILRKGMCYHNVVTFDEAVAASLCNEYPTVPFDVKWKAIARLAWPMCRRCWHSSACKWGKYIYCTGTLRAK